MKNSLLCKNIKYLIDTTEGVNQYRLGKGIGVNYRTVHKWYVGETEPIKHLDAICSFFGISSTKIKNVDLEAIKDGIYWESHDSDLIEKQVDNLILNDKLDELKPTTIRYLEEIGVNVCQDNDTGIVELSWSQNGKAHFFKCDDAILEDLTYIIHIETLRTLKNISDYYNSKRELEE